MNTANTWTDKEDYLILNNKKFNESWSVFRERELPWRSLNAIRLRAQRALKVSNGHFRKRTHTFKEDLWDTPNLESSYWMGMIATDGCLRKYGTVYNGHSLVIELQTSDKNHLEKFKDFCEFTGPVSGPYFKRGSSTHVLSINFGDVWLDGLKNNFNITERKTFTLQPPNLKDLYLIQSYLIGALDGDGSVFYTENRGPKELCLSLVSASKDFAYWVNDQLSYILKNQSTFGDKSYRKVCHTRDYFRVAFSGLSAAVLVDYFRQFPLPKLDRKWNNPKIVEFIELQKQKYPDKFLTLEIPAEFRP